MTSINEYDYYLPKELIAQKPVDKREQSRMLFFNGNQIQDLLFSDILNFVKPGDVFLINVSKVFKSEIIGKKSTGSKCRVVLLEQIQTNKKIYKCFIETRNPKVGNMLILGSNKAKILKVADFDFLIEFDKPPSPSEFRYAIPPYVKLRREDEEDYQTIYSEKSGSIASPTAGLHFSKELIKQMKKKGVKFAKVLLHVGIGTFEKIKSKEIENHKMHEEFFELDEQTAHMINNRTGRLFVVGTTSLRVLESCSKNGKVFASSGFTNLYIHPKYKFQSSFDFFITNFHLPKTSLLVLLSSLLPNWRDIYNHAIRNKYRFFSFGDCMLIKVNL